MSVKSRIDLVHQALRELGVLAAGQSAEAEDFLTVDFHIEGLLASLDRREIVTVDDDDEIPTEWFLALATLLADRSASAFGLPGLPSSPSAKDPVQAAEDELRAITYARPTYEPLRTDYF